MTKIASGWIYGQGYTYLEFNVLTQTPEMVLVTWQVSNIRPEGSEVELAEYAWHTVWSEI